jgi:hypothetical protein
MKGWTVGIAIAILAAVAAGAFLTEPYWMPATNQDEPFELFRTEGILNFVRIGEKAPSPALFHVADDICGDAARCQVRYWVSEPLPTDEKRAEALARLVEQENYALYDRNSNDGIDMLIVGGVDVRR